VCYDSPMKSRGLQKRGNKMNTNTDLETCGYCVTEYPYSQLRTNADGAAICSVCWAEGEGE
jgi:hypothetical protein